MPYGKRKETKFRMKRFRYALLSLPICGILLLSGCSVQEGVRTSQFGSRLEQATSILEGAADEIEQFLA